MDSPPEENSSLQDLNGNRTAAVKIRIDIMGNHPGFQIPRLTQGRICTARYRRESVVGQYKFDALNKDIPAGRIAVGGDGERLHSPLVLSPVAVRFA